ncbi:MAG: hypothetical protein PHV33_13950 [Elusimicrobiales bacterium]|nr:hypothetical protein [Elusimicrobiales bacterium]
MKKTITFAAVFLGLVGMASASGYNYESSRMDSGKLFFEMQTGKRMGSGSPVAMKGDFSPVEKAKINAMPHDYGKLTHKAPPLLNSVGTVKSASGNHGKKTGLIVGGVVVVGAVVATALIAPEFAILAAGGAVIVMVGLMAN